MRWFIESTEHSAWHVINRQQMKMTIAIIVEEGVSEKHDTVSYRLCGGTECDQWMVWYGNNRVSIRGSQEALESVSWKQQSGMLLYCNEALCPSLRAWDKNHISYLNSRRTDPKKSSDLLVDFRWVLTDQSQYELHTNTLRNMHFCQEPGQMVLSLLMDICVHNNIFKIMIS